ncbi:MAG: 1,4-dihydroxy-2-naphthoate polyprenyltransferase, partial [Nitriliruptoraceae bacterium]|nr:1,4-dihydroxy-2-naphthoate polyprenyltransferase [Nitriliruptoraceae bacterium]
LLALLVALALQVAVNYANDLFDGIAGVDTEARTGPRRAVASGLIAPTAMKRAMLVALGVAAVAGLVLAARVGWELLAVGALAMLATLGYSGGSKPYASRGLGEISVFIFFGLVATAGSAYVQDGRLTTLAVLASVPVGAVAVALLVVNNLRDIPTDEVAGKRTLAVRLGEARTRGLFQALIIGSIAMALPLALVAASPLPLAALIAVPFARRPMLVVGSAPLGRELVAALESTGRFQLVLAVLLAAGLALA